MRQARLDGDRRSDRALARELLGDDEGDAVVARLVRALPWLVRARLVSSRRIAAVVALALLAPISVAGAVRLLTRPAPRAEAVLEVQRRSADGTTTNVYAIPLTSEQIASTSPIDVDLGRRPTWRIADSVIRYVQGWSVRPDGRGWTMTRSVPDSGVLDVFDVGTDGSLRRLTFGPKDDLAPSWAPDGSALAFATMRWTTHGHYDLAVYDTLTRRVRRLTGPDDATDQGTRWSPDGSRIATRRVGPTGDVSLCILDVDGTHERCFVPEREQFVPLDWTDAHHLLYAAYAPGQTELRRLDVDTRDEQVVRSDEAGTAYYLSPNGEYVLCTCIRPGYPRGASFFFAVEHPTELKAIRVVPADARDVNVEWAPTSPRRPFLAHLRIVLGPGQPTTTAPYQLRASGLDTAGQPVDGGVVRWRSLDTTVATVDSIGLLHARRAGRWAVEASAGGWRRATAQGILAASPMPRVVLDERWTHGLAPTWVPFGVPRPVIVPNSVLGTAFSQNGDGSFWSGAFTARAFDVRGGLWVEADLSVPLTALGPSQDQLVSLFAPRDSLRWATWDRRTGDFPPTASCTLRYPGLSLTTAYGDSLAFEAPGTIARAVPVPKSYRHGEPFHALVQVFPDGRCGFAVDGRPLYVTEPAYFDRGARVMLYGNSQETHDLVGRVRVVAGIAPDIAWDSIVHDR